MLHLYSFDLHLGGYMQVLDSCIYHKHIIINKTHTWNRFTYNDTKRMDFSCTWKENKKNDSAQLTFKEKGQKIRCKNLQQQLSISQIKSISSNILKFNIASS